VSELRFNLPSARPFNPPRKSASESLLPTVAFFTHRRSRSYATTSSTNSLESRDDVNIPKLDPLDLSLGQELAGGGFSGREAKLGKLIIENEGLKMLDLLVAANMALWWRGYDRSNTKSRPD
jgi:hypothetical protein